MIQFGESLITGKTNPCEFSNQDADYPWGEGLQQERSKGAFGVSDKDLFLVLDDCETDEFTL